MPVLNSYPLKVIDTGALQKRGAFASGWEPAFQGYVYSVGGQEVYALRGRDAGSTTYYRYEAFMRFPMDTLPADFTIDSVSVRLVRGVTAVSGALNAYFKWRNLNHWPPKSTDYATAGDVATAVGSIAAADNTSPITVPLTASVSDLQVQMATTNVAAGRPYTVSPTPSVPDTGSTELTDGLYASTSTSDAKWVGWNAGTPTVTIDLGSEKTLTRALIHLASLTSSSINVPTSIAVLGSTDNVTFTPIVTKTSTELGLIDGTQVNQQQQLAELSLTGSYRWVRFVLTRNGAASVYVSNIEVFDNTLSKYAILHMFIDTTVAGAPTTMNGRTYVSNSQGGTSTGPMLTVTYQGVQANLAASAAIVTNVYAGLAPLIRVKSTPNMAVSATAAISITQKVAATASVALVSNAGLAPLKKLSGLGQVEVQAKDNSKITSSSKRQNFTLEPEFQGLSPL